jgi:arabinan endo-1,5-alpha-L-arabinosidase
LLTSPQVSAGRGHCYCRRVRLFSVFPAVLIGTAMAACSSSSETAPGSPQGDAGFAEPGLDSGAQPEAAPLQEGGRDAYPGPTEAASPEAATPCSTRVSYGSAWIHSSNHPAMYDVAQVRVTWDGTCIDDGANSYALLSNGWKPYFTGNSACILALDYQGSCGTVPSACTTRVTYGPAWVPPANHPAHYDDVPGRVFGDGACHAAGGQTYADLSNGWQPHFNGGCALSFEHTQCGGLYANPVIPHDCADPGVIRDGSQYVLACTSGNAANAYPIYTSPDLATWTAHGHIFPAGSWPSWARRDFWAPEIHRVGAGYVAYFSARGADGKLSIGAASAPAALGPFTDIGQPLVHDPAMGLIDASEITAPGGTPYALWKEDGNAVGRPTPIHAAQLAADGLSIAGSPATLITNDQPWEGAVTEAPFMVQNGGTFYLFYSGNSYANATYAVGVAKATSPLGPFTKAGGPIVATAGSWVGPGHCSVVDTPTGDTYMVYHAWPNGCVNGPGCGREPLTDAVFWQGGWPAVPLAPSMTSRPLP